MLQPSVGPSAHGTVHRIGVVKLTKLLAYACSLNTESNEFPRGSLCESFIHECAKSSLVYR